MPDTLPLAGKTVVLHEISGIASLNLSRALARAGCLVVGRASDWRESAELVRRTKPDFVMVDIELPEIDDVTVIGRAIAESSSCLIIITPDAPSAAEEQARTLGACGYLCKPYSTEFLTFSLQQALQRCYEGRDCHNPS